MIGDWNIKKEEFVNEITKEGIEHYTYGTEIGGSRVVKEIETERLIDYSITNTDIIVVEENYLKNWHISDRYPVELIIGWSVSLNEQVNKLILDREKLKDVKVIKKL